MLRSNRARGIALALVVPLFAVGHWSRTGMPVAQGCSGAGPVATGWTSLELAAGNFDATPLAVDVATDGFFLLRGFAQDLSPTAKVDEVSIQVTQADGAAVPGQLKLLSPDSTSFLLGWSADAPLTVGTTLTATFSAPSSIQVPVGGEARLSVVGEPTVLSTAQLSLGSWYDYGHGVGLADWNSCTNATTGCSRTIPATEERRVAVEAVWTHPQSSGVVAWEARFAPPANQPDAYVTVPVSSFFESRPDSPTAASLVVFGNAPESYCATLTVKDLRTGNEVSTEACGTPTPPLTTQLDYPLAQCTEPPTPELTARWCEINPTSQHAACVKARAERGDAGSVVADDPDGGTRPVDVNAGTPVRERSDGGCQVGGMGTRAVASPWFALALALLMRRRKA